MKGIKCVKYKDIIKMPHRTSPFHRRMPLFERAAQFAPFAALTGYDELIIETGRVVDKKAEPSDEEIDALNQAMTEIIERIKEKPELEAAVFFPDERKEGGCYRMITGRAVRYDEEKLLFILEDGSKISVYDIIEIKIKEKPAHEK